jgi:hypothetical protein
MGRMVEMSTMSSPRSTTFDGQMYAIETLVTDTKAWDVVSYTARTITVRRRVALSGGLVGGAARRSPNHDQGTFPVLLTRTESDLRAEKRRLRLRKDGTYRVGAGGRPLVFTNVEPEELTDYRY